MTVYNQYIEAINLAKKKFLVSSETSAQRDLKEEQRISTAIEKITTSIIDSYIPPAPGSEPHSTALPQAMVDAIQEGKMEHVMFPKGTKPQHQYRDMHAEMKITQRLYDNGLMSKDDFFYIGVSRKCCLNCECCIKAINEVKGQDILTVREIDGHRTPYPAYDPPFLDGNRAIKAKFLEIRAELPEYENPLVFPEVHMTKHPKRDHDEPTSPPSPKTAHFSQKPSATNPKQRHDRSLSPPVERVSLSEELFSTTPSVATAITNMRRALAPTPSLEPSREVAIGRPPSPPRKRNNGSRG